MFTIQDSEALRQVVGWVTALIELLKTMKGQRPKDRERIGPSRTRLTMPDGTTFETDTSVVMLMDRPTIIESARQVAAPLQRDGVNGLRIERPNEPTVVLEKGDLAAFGEPTESEVPLGTTRVEILLTIIQPSFSEQYVWRVDDGSGAFQVRVEDESFMGRVHRQEISFAEGDSIKAVMEIRQTTERGKLKAERVVVRVLDYFPTSRPLGLPFVDQP